MKLISIILLFFLTSSVFVSAMINPLYKECLQRGYEVGTYWPHDPVFNESREGVIEEACKFPDGTACDMYAFNNGSCGQDFKIENYCIKEGEYVWDLDKCCSGLEPYICFQCMGQRTCQPIGTGKYEWFYFAIKHPSFLLPFVILGIIIAIILYITIKSLKKR